MQLCTVHVSSTTSTPPLVMPCWPLRSVPYAAVHCTRFVHYINTSTGHAMLATEECSLCICALHTFRPLHQHLLWSCHIGH
jgi:hypothetical protein